MTEQQRAQLTEIYQHILNAGVAYAYRQTNAGHPVYPSAEALERIAAVFASPTPDLEFTVISTPGPQGSKRHIGRGRMVESSAKVAPWRDSVAWAAREAMQGRAPIDGPVICQMTFIFPRPKSRKKTALHDRQPDLDKLIRSTADAMTQAGVWADDARVVEYRETGKVYADAAGLGINSGAVVRVWRAV